MCVWFFTDTVQSCYNMVDCLYNTHDWQCMAALWGQVISWWRYQMETFSTLLSLCEGNPPVIGGSPHKGQWSRVLMFSLICAWTNNWTNNQDAGDFKCYHAYYDITVMMVDCLHIHNTRNLKHLTILMIDTAWLTCEAKIFRPGCLSRFRSCSFVVCWKSVMFFHWYSAICCNIADGFSPNVSE